jgi:hypothetical protein
MADKPKTILVMRHAEKPEDSSDPDLSRAGHVRRQVAPAVQIRVSRTASLARMG